MIFLYIIISVAIFMAISFIIIILLPHKSNTSFEKKLTNYLIEYTSNFKLSKVDNQPYNLILELNNIKYYLKLINLPPYAVLQINNYITWEIRYGAGDKPGKAEPYKRYLKDIEPFMNLNVYENEQKIAILIPSAKKIVKYINESEIIFVTNDTDVFGIKIINNDDLNFFIKNR